VREKATWKEKLAGGEKRAILSVKNLALDKERMSTSAGGSSGSSKKGLLRRVTSREERVRGTDQKRASTVAKEGGAHVPSDRS